MFVVVVLSLVTRGFVDHFHSRVAIAASATGKREAVIGWERVGDAGGGHKEEGGDDEERVEGSEEEERGPYTDTRLPRHLQGNKKQD